MSVHHAAPGRPSTPWLPHPTLTAAAGVLAIVIRFATSLRGARR